MLKEIQLILSKLSINGINQNKNQIQTMTKNKSQVNKIEEQFKMTSYSIINLLSTINAISNNFVSKNNYYSKPFFSRYTIRRKKLSISY